MTFVTLCLIQLDVSIETSLKLSKQWKAIKMEVARKYVKRISEYCSKITEMFQVAVTRQVGGVLVFLKTKPATSSS